MPAEAAVTRRPWRWLVLLAVVANIGISYYSSVYPLNGQTMRQVSAKYPTLLTPAGYAFSIWGLIFLGQLGYAGWQLLPAQRTHVLPEVLARPLVVAHLTTAAWVVLFAYEQIFPSIGVMLLILGSLIMVYGRGRRRVLATAAPAWTSWAASLYLGWISVAAVINITIGVQQLWHPAMGLAVTVSLAMIFIIVVIALIMSRTNGEFGFALVVAWALVALWVAKLREVPELGWAALAGAVVAAVAGFALHRLNGRKEPWQIAAEAAAAAEAEIAARRTEPQG